MGDLHQRWFGDPAAVTALSEALAPCVRERAVVRMSWDQPTHTGSIRLYVDRASLACHPSRPDGAVELGPLAPIGRALAGYRDRISGAYDMRVASFRVELEALRAADLCRLTLGGQYPPDGSTWAPCVELGGRRVCAPGEAARTRFVFADSADTAALSACLGG